MIRSILLWCLCFILVACSGGDNIVLPDKAKLLAFGDSLTFGIGASEGADYPSVLARLTGHEVINAGVSGETTAQGLIRFEHVIEAESPDLVILLEGGNDFLRNQDKTETEANLQNMLALATEKRIPVILISVPQKGLFLNDAPMFERLAKQPSVTLLPEVLATLLTQPKFKSDAVHLNDAGYTELAHAIANLLR